MKKLFTFFGFTLFFSQVFSQSIPELLYYKFEESGATVTNYASSPPVGTATATIMGGVTQGGPGICNGSLIGSGVSSTTDYLNTGWIPNLGNGSWTISFRTSGISTDATLYYIFGDVGTNSFRCFTNGLAGSTNWVIRGGGLTDTYINGGALSTPTMCTYVYDQSLNQVRGYLNGALVTTVAQGAVNLTGTGPFKVMGYGSNVGAPAGGLLDEFRLYDRALNDQEVLDIYNANYSGFLGTDQAICPGDTVTLTTNLPASTYLWSDGSTNDTLFVQTADTFSVTISGACANGSDTIVYTSLATSVNLTAGTCEPTYVAPSGAVYTVSGIYLDTIPNAVGCDSLITIDLTMNSNSTNTINPIECGAFYNSPAGNVYTVDGTYTDTLINAIGCDSLITINLTFPTVNVGVSQAGTDGEDLSSNASGASYQWINCPSFTVIAGATNQNFTATSDGQYGVIVTENGCTDTSACFTVAGLGISMNDVEELIQLYPNPGSGQFTLDFGFEMSGSIDITNSLGQIVFAQIFPETNKLNVEFNAEPGIYFITIRNASSEKLTLRYIKK